MKSIMLLPMDLVVLLSCAIVIQHANASLFSKAPLPPPNLKSLCSGIETKLRTPEDLVTMAGQGDQEHGCSEQVIQAVNDLKNIVQTSSCCTKANIDAFITFVDKYLKATTEEEATAESRLPKPLTNYAISYGMLVGYKCKSEMLHAFAFRTEVALLGRFGKEKFVEFQQNLGHQSRLSMILEPIAKDGEVVLPADLFAVVPGLEEELVPYLSKSDGLEQLKDLCQNTLQPLYEPFLLPLSRLQRAGFNPDSPEYPKENKEMVSFWTTATFLCELAKLTKETDQVDHDVEQELNQMRELKPTANVQGLVQCKVPTVVEQKSLDPYSSESLFKPRTIIIGAVKGKLKPSVKSYDANKDEKERLHDLLQERSFRVIKMLARKGAYKAVIKTLVKKWASKTDSGADSKAAEQDLIELLEAPEQDSVLVRSANGLKRGSKLVGYWSLKVIGFVLKYSVFAILGLLMACLSDGNGTAAVETSAVGRG